MKRLFLLLLFPTLLHAGTSRYVDAPELQTKDRAAINLNFQNVDQEFGKVSYKSKTELISGKKQFSENVNIGVSHPINSLRYLDIENTHSGVNAGDIIRFIHRNDADDAVATVDIVKYSKGAFYINANDTASTNAIIFGVGGTERLRIDNNGYVGIGETSLGNKLTIGANSDTSNINTRINGKTSTGASAGTLTNAPSAGNPTGYLSVDINGTERKIPYW